MVNDRKEEGCKQKENKCGKQGQINWKTRKESQSISVEEEETEGERASLTSMVKRRR
jgi:hypothetical protein